MTHPPYRNSGAPSKGRSSIALQTARRPELKVPPKRGVKTRRSLEAEQSLLGAVLIDAEALSVARSMIRASDFGFSNHIPVWEAIVELDNRKVAVDIVTLSELMRDSDALDGIGGVEYLASLMEACPSSGNVAEYARVVLQNSVARELAQSLEIAAGQFQFFPDSSAAGLFPSANIAGVSVILKNTLTTLKTAEERLQGAAAGARYSDDMALDALVSEVSWLWNGWVPKGALTLLAGRPGSGKSTLALDLFARLIRVARGEYAEWPDESPIELELSPEQKFLWIDTESALGIFRARLNSWRIPRGHFLFPEGRELEPLRVDNDRDWGWIRRAVADTKTPLVVIDSLARSHSGEENSNEYMTYIMGRIADLASEFDTSPILIHHLGKMPAGLPQWPLDQDMIRGASAITALPRSILGVGRPSQHEPSYGMMSLKLSIAAPPEPLGYTITEVGPAWGNAPILVANGGEPSAHERAAGFLLEYLANGPKWATDVEKAAEAQGYSKRTLDRAKGNLVRSYRLAGRWAWELTNKKLEKPGASQFLPGEII
ncbi:hypothetical protein EON83_00165 [bacterium]|nr:MAG: hypothetical protein EON83_00165 [bacterium]